MKALGVSIDELFDALSRGNSNTGGAYIEKNNKAFTIRGIGLATTLEEIGKSVVKNNVGAPVLIRDVAEVDYGNSIRYGAMTMNGNGEVVGGIIMMMKGENGSEVIARIKSRMKQIEASLPEGLIIEPFIDREKLVSKAIKTVYTNLIEGAIIVVLVILFLPGQLESQFACCFCHSAIHAFRLRTNERIWCSRKPDESWRYRLRITCRSRHYRC
ncbi:MAG: efflux RND transporter permease subunit [Sporocytophaga sp.]|nr:efflux RND transporter permease subunit [Sporocytophaga sp.]